MGYHIIPHTFEEWKYCLIHKCGITPHEGFVRERLQVYLDTEHPETKQFVALYGKQHLHNIIYWLKQI